MGKLVGTMKTTLALVAILVVTVFECAGCGGAGGAATPNPEANPAFVYLQLDGTVANKLNFYRALVSDPTHPTLLASSTGPLNVNGVISAAIDPKTLKVYYNEPTDGSKIHVVDWDGLNDHVLFTDSQFSSFVGFLPSGKLSFLDAPDLGPRKQMQIDVVTGAISPVTPIQGFQVPSYHAWNRTRTEFLGWDQDAGLVRQSATSSASSTLGIQGYGEFAPDNTVLANVSVYKVERFTLNGTLIEPVSGNYEIADFHQVGNKGVIGEWIHGDPNGETVFMKFGDSAPTTLVHGVFLDSVEVGG